MIEDNMYEIRWLCLRRNHNELQVVRDSRSESPASPLPPSSCTHSSWRGPRPPPAAPLPHRPRLRLALRQLCELCQTRDRYPQLRGLSADANAAQLAVI